MFFFLQTKAGKFVFFFFQAEDGIRDLIVTGVQTCALPISRPGARSGSTIQRKARGRLAPSTEAASSSPTGISWRKPVRSQMTSGRAKDVLARMRASHVSRSDNARIKR